jgi:hypothetical protein
LPVIVSMYQQYGRFCDMLIENRLSRSLGLNMP